MSRPLNVVWMVADHLLHANHRFVGSAPPLQARLAREGLCFTRAYSVLPICSPARASMMTGLYPHAHGLTENDGRFGGRAGLDPEDWLLHRPLLAAGTRCAWFGKWHLDNARGADAYGFEGEAPPGYGYPYGAESYRAYLARQGLEAPVATITMPGESAIPAGTRIALCEQADWFDFEAGAARLEGPARTHEAFYVADLATRWLEGIGDSPFFLRVDPWGPHPPYLLADPFDRGLDPAAVEPPANLGSDLAGRPAHHRAYRASWDATLGLDDPGWCALIARAQAHVRLVETALLGILESLDRLGLRDTTLVVFTADHGDAVGSNGGVCNKGGLMVEETLRVPLLVRGPGVAPGQRCRRLVANFDLAPTVLDLCGLDRPHDLQARSLAPLLRSPEAPGRAGLMTQHYGLHEPVLQRAYHSDHWKLVVQADGFLELYDLQADPCELRNLAGSKAHSTVLAAMGQGLRAAMAQSEDKSLELPC